MTQADDEPMAEGVISVARERLYQPAEAWSRSEMAGVKPASFALALLVHFGCILGFIILLGIDPPKAPTGDPIVVEFLGSVAGEGDAASDTKAPSAPPSPVPAPVPAPSAVPEPLPVPADPPSPPKAAPPPPPSLPPAGEAAPDAPADAPAKPPSAETPPDQAEAPAMPAFVKPQDDLKPADAKSAGTLSAEAVPEPAKPDPTKPAPPEIAPPPDALTVSGPAPDAVPQSLPAKPKTVPLYSMLQMDMAGMPDSFRAIMSGTGASLAQDYEGLINGALGRARDLEAQAQRQGLKGMVIVGFSIDDAGRMTDLAVVRSSGSRKLDDIALAMWRRAGPFPPPPAGATRHFHKALIFGQ